MTPDTPPKLNPEMFREKPNKTMTETITIAVDINIEYENDLGRRHIIGFLAEQFAANMSGVGSAKGHYSAKSIQGSAREVKPIARNDEQSGGPEFEEMTHTNL